MYGLSEVITLMLALGGFGVDSNAKAPTADAVLAYTVEDADVFGYLDVSAVVPRNYKVVIGLPDDPAVKGVPDLLAFAKKVKANAEGVRGMAKAASGVDPITDITSVTVFVDFAPGGARQQMIVARGTFPADVVEKIAKLAGETTGTIDGRATLEIDPTMFVGTSKDGALIAGTKAWVEPRVDDDWKAPKRKKGSTWATVAKRIDDGPFALVVARPDDATAADLAAALGKNVAADLIAGGELAILGLHHDGVYFHWKDRTKEGLARVKLAVEGATDVARAAHLAPRGIAKLIVAALPSYAGVSTELDALIAKKDEFWKVVDDMSGDGQFEAKLDVDKKARTLTMRAKGKSLSDVVPFAAAIPVAVIVGATLAEDAARPVPPPPRRPTKPRTGKGGVTEPPKPTKKKDATPKK